MHHESERKRRSGKRGHRGVGVLVGKVKLYEAHSERCEPRDERFEVAVSGDNSPWRADVDAGGTLVLTLDDLPAAEEPA